MPAVTHPCVDCRQPIRFPEVPSDATCPNCNLWQYVNRDNRTGRYPSTWHPTGSS